MAAHSEKSDACDACNFETTELTEVDAWARTPGHGPFTPNDQKEWVWMCEVCRSTLAGNVFLYPSNYDGNTQVLASTICWGINHLAKLIKERS